jgi:D-aminoacyl-tRNA deacylase
MNRIVILVSDEDPAALNIRDSLLERVDWEPVGRPGDLGSPVGEEGAPDWGPLGDHLVEDSPPVYKHPSAPCVMVGLKGDKLYWEGIDKQILGLVPGVDLIIFPSRHRSESGLRTLTVHPTGNYGPADFGGRPGELSICAPFPQTVALRHLQRRARRAELDHKVSFECTHHGPLISTPHFFIEIGSDDAAWVEKASGDVLAGAVLDVVECNMSGDVDAVVGVGGGHYCPRFTEVALSKECAMGHMIPNYALDHGEGALRQAVVRTPGARFIYLHKKSMKGARYRQLRDWFTDARGGGLREIRSGDLEDLRD